jgi:spermidine/putrescine transport system substrate-binding protein
MDFVYRPEIAAMIAGFVAYVTPVPEAQGELVFPTPEQRGALRTYRELNTDEELSLWNATFGEFFV